MNAFHESGATPAHAALPEISSSHSPDYWVRCVQDHNWTAISHLPVGLRRALQYIAAHYSESITAEQLAEQAYVSVSHLRFLFRDHLGIPFKLFLQRVRIARAQLLLLELPPQRVTAVALSVGFNDFSHFQKCFRQIVGHAPGELRRARK
jgi:transcriptional regulator GlxA family with amidase domain